MKINFKLKYFIFIKLIEVPGMTQINAKMGLTVSQL